MEEKEFFIDHDGIKLHAKMAYPTEMKEKMPIVLLFHGLTGNMEEEHILAVRDAITESGFIALRVELYGHGKSEGLFRNHNVSLWVNEIIYIVDYVRTLDAVSDIYLCGHSQGGLSVILAAAMKREQVKGLIPLAPATNIVDDCKKGDLFGSIFSTDAVPDEITLWDEYTVTGNYARIGRTLHYEEAMKEYTGPVLIIHGTEDEAVPVSYAVSANKIYKNCTLVLIEGDNHCYNYHLDQVTAALKKWLIENK